MFYFGADYYPEHWPEARWTEDARLMAEAGFNVVRLAEFAWSRMEPEDGVYDFAWLDRAISILSEHDIRVVLGTPTASPPPWLMAKGPELFLVREDGRRVTFGNRREYCPNNPAYHDHTRRIVARMADRYGDHPSVIGWQVDNEFGARCYCPTCRGGFQEWLRRRYGSLDELNERWGTVFWGHEYTDWEQVPVPVETSESPNPGLALDFGRFASDSYVAYQQMQVDILREKCPEHFVTHNLMGFGYDRIDYFDLARELDFVAWDIYPRGFWDPYAAVDPSGVALSADTMRGLKGQNYWVMEQQSGPSGWETMSVMPRPGELRLWAYQSIAHGADGIVFFRWRTCRFGTEEYWHGVLDHHGIPGRRYAEIKQMGTELKRIGDQIHGTCLKPQVAMLLSYDSRFAFQIQPGHPQFSYSGHFHHIYRALHGRNVPADIVAPAGDISSYRFVIAPALHVVPETVAANLRQFVEHGGVLMVTPRSGVKDKYNAVVNQRLPGLLAELCGVEVEGYDTLPEGAGNPLEFALPNLAGQRASARLWCDVLKSKATTVVARYAQDYYAGKPAITLNRVGQGWVVYVGTFGEEALYEALADWLLELAGVDPLPAAPQGVEIAERWQGDRLLLFVLNHTDEEQQVSLDVACLDLLEGGAVAEGTAVIAPRDVMILLSQQ
jgi:beta-galactosidase